MKERRGFWISAAIGWAIIAYGLRGLFHHHVDTRPPNLGLFVIGGDVVHDLLFAPVVLLIGVAVARVAPRRWRSGVQAALIISGCLMLFAYPLVRDYARVIHNPSSLPHNYTANLTIVIGAVWVVTLAVFVFRARAGRSQVSQHALRRQDCVEPEQEP